MSLLTGRNTPDFAKDTVYRFMKMFYDAMTARTALIFTRYMMLSLKSRESNDNRSFSELFLYFSDEMADITWMQALFLSKNFFVAYQGRKKWLTRYPLILSAACQGFPRGLKVSFLYLYRNAYGN